MVFGFISQDKDEEYVRNREQNIADAIDLLPRLTTGIDVNVMFRKCVRIFSMLISGLSHAHVIICFILAFTENVYLAGLMILSSPGNVPYLIC